MSYGGYQQAPSTEQGYYDNYGQDVEMQHYSQQASNTLSQNEFLNRIQFLRDSINNLRSDVQNIATLHRRALSDSDGGQAQQQLDQITANTQASNQGIRDQLKFLANDAHKTTEPGLRQTKDRQVSTIKSEFMQALNEYQSEESGFSNQYRQQIARQYRIVNPDASEDEVRQATEADWGNEGVFQTALNSNRTGQASNVLGNVRARHNELQRIEKTMMELAQMFQDLAVLVEQQEPIIQQTEDNAQKTVDDIDTGNEHVAKGIQSARNWRKYKWWCLLVVVIILIIIAIVVAVVVTNAQKATNTAGAATNPQ